MVVSAVLGSLALACDANVTSVGAWQPSVGKPSPSSQPYFEAESGELSGGFSVASDASASNGAYLAPPATAAPDGMPGVARAAYRFEVLESGDYIIWGRIWAPGASNNRFWFRVDGGDWHLWRISVGNIWYWDDLHEDTDYGHPLVFPLTVGVHELAIANAVPGAKLDRLYVTARADAPPGNDTLCSPPHSIDVDRVCRPSCGSHATKDMTTTCVESVCAERELIEAYDCDICCLVPRMP